MIFVSFNRLRNSYWELENCNKNKSLEEGTDEIGKNKFTLSFQDHLYLCIINY